jgi:hypothetical protein
MHTCIKSQKWRNTMAGKVKGGISKNAQRVGAQKMICKCGGEIKMHTVAAHKGKMSHYAECDKCHAKARRPKDLF